MKILLAIFICAFPFVTDADEPWMYPVTIGPTPSLTELKSHSLAIHYVEKGGVRISDSPSRVVDANVASFDTIVKWYSGKLGGTNLAEKLASYKARAKEDPEIQQGQAFGPTSTHQTILYRFTPAHKQITIVPVWSKKSAEH